MVSTKNHLAELPKHYRPVRSCQTGTLKTRHGGRQSSLIPIGMIHIPMPVAYPKELIDSLMSELDEISTFPTPDWL